MKRILIIAMALMITLTGCSNTNNNDGDINKQVSSENTVENVQDKTKPQDSENTQAKIDSSKTKDGGSTKIKLDKGYHDYEGYINNNLKIIMSLYPSENDMIGSYFYDSQRKEIQLKGKLEGNKIVLSEYDESGTNTGTFRGTIDANEKVEGTWTSSDGKKSYPFTLNLTSIINGSSYGKRYAVAISDNRTDQDVENFVNNIQSYIKSDNKEQLAELVAYPISVKIKDKYANIQNKDEFIKNYDKIFYPKYKEAMSTAYTKYLFVNYKGIMFGSGVQNMWINDVTPDNGSPELLITAVVN